MTDATSDRSSGSIGRVFKTGLIVFFVLLVVLVVVAWWLGDDVLPMEYEGFD
jgi:uncharacterized membrane protein YdbT with pleckstrin-like domain